MKLVPLISSEGVSLVAVYVVRVPAKIKSEYLIPLKQCEESLSATETEIYFTLRI